MNWFFLFLSILPTFLPWAGQAMRAVQAPVQVAQAAQVVHTVLRPLQEAVPPEAGQPNVIFHQGRWWKWDGTQWWVWTPAAQTTTYLAQGGPVYVVR